MTRIADFNIDQRYQAKVKKTQRLTPLDTDEIRELILEVNEPEFHCQIDQSFGVLVETNGEFGNVMHHRLYSNADLPKQEKGQTQLTMLVKRCSYVDEFNGELYQGVASNFLCDCKEGDEITITGPFQMPFAVPQDKSANLILISMGTGIAPFRAFVKHIYNQVEDWKGNIRLFYGARSGLELLYLNDKDGDLTQYYDESTFEAFAALSPRPHWADPIALDKTLEAQSEEIKQMLGLSNTYIYVAGYEKIRPMLDTAFANILGSREAWMLRKAELIAGKKWAEVIY